MNAGVIVFLFLLVFSFLGLPIFLSIGVGTVIAMVVGGFPLEALPQKAFLGLNSSSLLSIPFFILAGNLMARGITQRLIAAANVVLGRVRGSLGAVTVLASALFGAISGSAVATVAAIGGMTIPAMQQEGYDKEYASALASAASLLGPMIPPSLSLIVYASLTDTSVQRLFLTTASPAIVCTIAFLIYTLVYGKRHNLPKQPKKTLREGLHVFRESIWALLMPVLVLGSIFGGICTVNEAAAVSAVSVAAIMILVGFSKASSYVVIASQLPQVFMETVSALTDSTFLILLIINIIFLVLGCLMDGNSILVMMVPLMLPLVQACGIDLLQFGVMSCVNIYIGCITPPVGVSLLVGTKIGRTSMGRTFIAILPCLFISLVILILVTYIPSFSLWLPRLLG